MVNDSALLHRLIIDDGDGGDSNIGKFKKYWNFPGLEFPQKQ